MNKLNSDSQVIKIVRKTRRNGKKRRKQRAKKIIGFFSPLSPASKQELFQKVYKFKDDMDEDLPIAYYSNLYDYLEEVFKGGIVQRFYNNFDEFELHFTEKVGIEKNRHVTPKNVIYIFLQYLTEIRDIPQKLTYMYELLLDIGYMYIIEPIPIDKIDSYSV